MKLFKILIILSIIACFLQRISVVGHDCHKNHNILSQTQEKGVYFAVCILQQDLDSGVSGIVRFKQVGDITFINAQIKGLKGGKHGFHIHEFGNCYGGCMTSGGHWNPLNKDHGGPQDEERHIGDLGNIVSDGDENEATLELEDKQISLEGIYSIIGRACVIHADEDDLGKGGQTDSTTTGHAGKRVACGTVGWSQPF